MVWRYRADADLVTDVPATRRIMPFLMRTRNESVVFFSQDVDVTRTLLWLAEVRTATTQRVTLLHLFLWAAARTLEARPRLNRFVAGGRHWQRRGIWVSFSAKKEKNDDSPIVVVKKRIDPAWTLPELVTHIEDGVQRGRSAERSSTDKELGLVFLLPTFLVSLVVRLMMRADHLGLLPRAVVEQDPLFASLFVANLGSIDMGAGFHHLYEYGNIPIFAVVGRAEPRDDGRTVLPVRYSFDERIEDGLYCTKALELLKAMVEDPEGHGALGARAST